MLTYRIGFFVAVVLRAMSIQALPALILPALESNPPERQLPPLLNLVAHTSPPKCNTLPFCNPDVFSVVAQELEALEQNGTSFDPKRLATMLRQRGLLPLMGLTRGLNIFANASSIKSKSIQPS